MILDTTFLVDLLRGDPEVADLARELDERGSPVVTAITVMELIEGAALADVPDRSRDRVHELLSGLTTASFDSRAGARAGTVSAELSERGEQIEIPDVVIAAVALERGESVLTRNTAHFERISGLDVEPY